MRILTIGDIHGEYAWRQAELDKFDLVIFVGDYTDSFTQSNLDIKKNLLDIIELASKEPDKYKLLLGNHDLPYYWGKPNESIQGTRAEAMWDLHIIFRDNHHLFSTAFQIDNYIWTHAGIHVGWYNRFMPAAIKEYELEGNLAEQLNYLFERNFPPLFVISHYRWGAAREGGPFWADWREVYRKPLPGYHQVFGHTRRLKPIETYFKNEDTSVTCVDRFGLPEFYELEL